MDTPDSISKGIYESAVMSLLDNRHVEDPFQVALSFYNLKEEFGSYQYFALDLSQLMRFQHYLWQSNVKSDTKHKFIDKLKQLASDFKTESQKDNLLDIVKSKGHEKIIDLQYAYDKLRRVKFCKPLVLSNFIESCILDEAFSKSYCEDSLYQNEIYDKKRSTSNYDWRVGEFLENELFNIKSRTYYMCLFFTLDPFDHKVYSLTTFGHEDDSENIDSVLRKVIKGNKKVHLLENSPSIDVIRQELLGVPSNEQNETDKISDLKGYLVLRLMEVIGSDEIETSKANHLRDSIIPLIKSCDSLDKLSAVRNIFEENRTLPQDKLTSIKQCLDAKT